MQYTPDTGVTFSDVIFRQYNNGALVAGPSATTARTMRTSWGYSEIIDDPGTSRGVKSVKHKRIRGLVNPTSESSYGPSTTLNVYTGSGAVWVDWWTELGGPSVLAFPSHTHSIRVSYPRDESRLVADAVHDFYSTNETDNLLNAIESPKMISQLAQLKSTCGSSQVRQSILDSLLIKKGKNLVKLGIPGIDKKVSARQRKLLERIFGSRGRRVSGLYLAYSFGVAPLLSDMRKVHDSMKTVQSALKKAIASSGKVVSLHRYDNGTLSYLRLSDSADLGTSYIDGYMKWRLSPVPCKRIVTVRGYRSHKYEMSSIAQLDYMLSRFLATGPTALAWELIPFSFVVDWFVDLRNITDRLDNLLTGSNKKILDVCVSEKYDAQHVMTWYSSAANMPDLDTLLYTENVSYYRRDPVVDYNIIGASGKFGKKQASLLGALIHQLVANWLDKR